MKFIAVKDVSGKEKRVPIFEHPEERDGVGSSAPKARKADPGRDGPAEGGSLRDLLNHSDRF